MVSVRRTSRRTRRPAHTVYDDAKEAMDLDAEEAAAAESSPASSSKRSSISSRGSRTGSTGKKAKATPPSKGKGSNSAKKKKTKKSSAKKKQPAVEDPPSTDEEEDDDDDEDEPMAEAEKEDGGDDDEKEEEEQQQQEEEDVDMEEEEEEEMEDSSSDEESDDDDEYKGPAAAAAAAKKKKSPAGAAAGRKSSPKGAAAGSHKGGPRAVTPMIESSAAAVPSRANRKAAQAALAGVAKRVLHAEEKSDSSLFAALVLVLQDGNKKGGGKKRTRGAGAAASKGSGGDDRTSRLDEICRRVLDDHDADPNKAQVDLFNLLFRSVGTTYKSLLKENEIELEVASDDDWEEVVTRITEGMQDTPPEHVLLAANPDGAVELSSGKGGGKRKRALVAPQEYRELYKDFWYRLGTVVLVGQQKDADDDGGGTSTAAANNTSNSRFQVEMARDILTRMIEVSGVGQPDIRAAASLAVYQFTQALLDHSADLWTKVQVATRQLNANRGSKSGRKAEMLKNQIDTWNRTLKELEEIVVQSVMNGVFTKRYKDSNKYIRAESLNAVLRFALSRPDLLLKSTYLKYFGWMLSDREAVVRESALMGFLVPLQEAERQGKRSNGPRIEKRSMSHAFDNFLKRITDCVIDNDLHVQERAMELMLALLRESFLDKLDDDAVWEQVNVRALAEDTTPIVRRDALRFVLEQLEEFDMERVDSEGKVAERIDALTKWLAHELAKSAIPVEEVRYKFVDYVVHSLRAMDDQKSLVSNWPALLHALESDAQTKEADRREAAVKQRVVLRMLVCGAELEVAATADGSFMAADMDSDIVAARTASHRALDPGKPKGKTKESSHEKLTQALLSALPDLLVTFKADTPVLRDLTVLPQYFLPTVFCSSSRKRDFTQLLSRISDVFLESTDNTVLQNCGLVLASMAQQNHARTGEALLQLKKTTCSLRDRLLQLLDERANLSTEANDEEDEEDDAPSARDMEYSIRLCLQRLIVLAKRWDIADLLGDDASEESDDDEMNSMCIALTEHMARELQARQLVYPEGDDSEDPFVLPEVWSKGDQSIHAYVAETVKVGLTLLLSVSAWRLNKEIKLIDDDEAETTGDVSDHVVLQMRNRLLKIVHYCFEQHIEPTEDDEDVVYSPEHLAFSKLLQEHACAVAGDLRFLFPKKWHDADSPFLRACALVDDDDNLVGGTHRFLSSSESKFRENENGEDDPSLARTILLPMGRGLSANWELGHRREAGWALRHITGSGQEAHTVVLSMARVIKKIDPIRVLESHMACLQQSFLDWMESEPEPEDLGDRPSEEEMAAFDHAEDMHKEQFTALEHLASRLSSSLGVGKLSKALAPAVVGFVGEGIRFAFSTGGVEEEEEESECFGARLPFLCIIAKYLNWIRKDKAHVSTLGKRFNDKESALRIHPDFEELDDFDRSTLDGFRKAGGFGRFVETAAAPASAGKSVATASRVGDDDESHEQSEHRPPRMSIASSVSSARSKTTLSPIQDADDDDDDDDDDDSLPKRRKLADFSSNRSLMSQSTAGQTQTTINEGNEEAEAAAEESSNDGTSD